MHLSLRHNTSTTHSWLHNKCLLTGVLFEDKEVFRLHDDLAKDLPNFEIFPEALSLGAPLIINLSLDEDKLFLLENLIRNLCAWRIHHNPDSEGFVWDQEDSSLYVICQKKKYPLGESGLAEEYLSKYFSTACLLQQWLSGIILSKDLSRAISGSIENEIIEEEISFRAVERLFRTSDSRSLQALRSNSGRIKAHQILTGLIGYEGLLKKSAEAPKLLSINAIKVFRKVPSAISDSPKFKLLAKIQKSKFSAKFN